MLFLLFCSSVFCSDSRIPVAPSPIGSSSDDLSLVDSNLQRTPRQEPRQLYSLPSTPPRLVKACRDVADNFGGGQVGDLIDWTGVSKAERREFLKQLKNAYLILREELKSRMRDPQIFAEAR